MQISGLREGPILGSKAHVLQAKLVKLRIYTHGWDVGFCTSMWRVEGPAASAKLVRWGAGAQVLQEMLDMLRNHQNNSHTARLEWIVIYLIVIEVIIGIFECLSIVGLVGKH